LGEPFFKKSYKVLQHYNVVASRQNIAGFLNSSTLLPDLTGSQIWLNPTYLANFEKRKRKHWDLNSCFSCLQRKKERTGRCSVFALQKKCKIICSIFPNAAIHFMSSSLSSSAAAPSSQMMQ
jgi:hypothetical protein